jgi:hypothetical protein
MFYRDRTTTPNFMKVNFSDPVFSNEESGTHLITPFLRKLNTHVIML